MRYHDITHDDMKNGDGLRVVLWVSGCSHRCENCQNPITWNPCDGLIFDDKAKQEIFTQLDEDYISGITFSGGDPLHYDNIKDVTQLCKEIKEVYKAKTIWIYTGFEWNYILSLADNEKEFLQYVDVLVDGRYVKELNDVNYHWAGSTNQRVVDVQQSLQQNKIILYE